MTRPVGPAPGHSFLLRRRDSSSLVVAAMLAATGGAGVRGMPRHGWAFRSAIAGLIAVGLAPAPLAARALRDLTAPSPALGHPIPYALALPDAYDREPMRRFPVLLLLHGTGGSHHDWLDRGGLAEG